MFPPLANRHGRRLASLTLALMTAFGAPARAVELPELGDAARLTLSESRETALGGQIMRQVRADRDFLDDPELSEYLNALGERLAGASADPSRQFLFFAVRDPSINAFALPGGYIGVHTGLIAAARNESELAGVLAHEIAHVSQNHIARLVDAQRGSTLATLAALAVAILAARSDQGQLGQAAIATAQAMSLQNQLDFTREHEREADRSGLQTLAKAGFSPAGMATFFERLQAQGRVSESQAPAYLRTHPLTYQRIADIQNRLGDFTPRAAADSLEFRLARAKVRAAQGEPAEALRRARVEAGERPEDAEALYGLAASALRAGDAKLASDTLVLLERRADAPMIATLAARIHGEAKRYPAALERLAAALRKHGTTRPLAEAHAETLLIAGRAEEARRVVTEYLRVWPGEPSLSKLLARANFDLGRLAEGHLAQADALRQLDLLGPAIEQLESARRIGGDYYTQSIVDARLREAREALKDEKDKGARPW
jgi:predicted Zn-dependent protease